MISNKELFVVISEEHYKESGTYEAFKTLEEAKEWEHCGPGIKYISEEKLNKIKALADKWKEQSYEPNRYEAAYLGICAQQIYKILEE